MRVFFLRGAAAIPGMTRKWGIEAGGAVESEVRKVNGAKSSALDRTNGVQEWSNDVHASKLKIDDAQGNLDPCDPIPAGYLCSRL